MENKDLVKLIKEPVSDFLIEAADMGLGELLERILSDQKILENIPYIRFGYLALTIKSNIQTAFFVKKYANFIGQIDSLNVEEYLSDNRVIEILGDNNKLEKIIEQTIIEIDRFQTEQKAKYLGKLFKKTFSEKVFSIEEYNTLMFSIDNMHSYLGIKCLKEYYDYRCRHEAELGTEAKRKIWSDSSHIDFSPLVSTGLLKLPNGGAFAGDLGGAYLNDLGKRFYESVIMEIEI
jgi:hypothetical protein